MAHSYLRLTSLVGSLLLASTASAGTIFVDANLNTGLNDGSSWADAHQGPNALRVALLAAVSGDQVFVADGSYKPANGTARGLSFSLTSGVEIYGSFLGGEATPADRPAFGTAPSILTADLNGDDSGGVITDNSYHVVKSGTSNSTAILDGFVITGGNSNAGGNNDRGGGILNIGASPTVRNCDFIGNRCTFGGGAGYINGGAPNFINCSFIDNIGGSFGGAFDIAVSGAVRYDRCTFMGNRASRAGALEIFSTNGVVISNSLFVDNTATGTSGGGAIWSGNGGTTTIVNCSIINNSATSNAHGGVRVQSPSVDIVSNTILWNNTGSGGAMGSANQMTSGHNVTYSIVTGGYAGAGNLASDPMLDAGWQPTVASPGTDAGNNTTVPPGAGIDLAGNARFFDIPSVADTGVGPAPVVDMGAFESTEITGVPYCFGDGAGTACPCANSGSGGQGCANSSASGAILSIAGSANVGADDLILNANNLLGGQPALLFVGNNQLGGGNGTVFGDGLRCVGGSVVRLGVRVPNVFGDASWGPGLGAVGGWLPGDTRNFQIWYRDPSGPCSTAFNLSNAYSVQFQ